MGILGTLLEPRSVEPSTLASPKQWLLEFFGGGPTRSGVTVNESSALALSTVWACVLAISGDIAKLPIRVVRERDDGTFEVVRRHNCKTILNRRPNTDPGTARAMRQSLIAFCLLQGNSFAEILRDNAGRAVGLIPLRAERMELHRRPAPDNTVYYVYTNSNGKRTTLEASDVFHMRGLSRDGIVGISVIAQARESMGNALAAERFAGNFWGRHAMPSGILKHPKKLTEDAEKNLRASWKEKYSGDNAWTPAILEEGMEWVASTIPPEDAQFLETRQFSVPEICRWFRVPPHKVHDLSRATFSNIEHQSQEYVTDSLLGWMTEFEQECQNKLFLLSEEDLSVKHITAALLRGDLKSRYEAYAIGRQWGFRSVNDIRRLEDEQLIGPEGDQYIVPVNMTTPDQVAKGLNKPQPAPTDPNTPTPRSIKAEGVRSFVAVMTPLFESTIGRVLRLEADKAKRAQGRGELAAWMAEFYPGHADHVRGAFFPDVEAAVKATAHVAGVELDTAILPDLVCSIAAAHVARSNKELAAPAAAIASWEGSRAKDQAAGMARQLADALVAKWQLQE